MLEAIEPPSAPPDEGIHLPDQFRVHDSKSANWVVRKIAQARAYADRIDIWAEAERRRARREEEFFLRQFHAQLYSWLTAELRERGGKAKSINLPAGRVGLRRNLARLKVTDASVALAWAREHRPQAIRRSESVPKSQLTDHFKATGELPAGTIIIPERDDMYVG